MRLCFKCSYPVSLFTYRCFRCGVLAPGFRRKRRGKRRRPGEARA